MKCKECGTKLMVIDSKRIKAGIQEIHYRCPKCEYEFKYKVSYSMWGY